MPRNARNIVFISQHYPPDNGGNAARIHDIATHLNGQEWEVTVLAPPPCYPPSEFDRSWRRKRTDAVDGVAVHRLWSWQPENENPRTVFRLAYYILFGVHAMLWLLLNVRRYDAVITTTPPISTGAPGLLAAALGKPWIVDVRDLWIDASISLGYLEAGSYLERVSRGFQRRVLHTADRITVTTESLEKTLQETYGETLGVKTVIIPNGVDVDRFRSEREPAAEPSVTEDTKHDGSGRPTIIYTGNIGSAQDLESVIRAMPHLSTEGAVLRLVGSGDVESELRKLTRKLDLEDRVEFYGLVSRTEVPALLGEATIGVAPLKDTEELAYAMPTKVYEYMASGLPIVVTGRGEIEQFMAESGGGVHVENDPEQIAEQLDELLTDDRYRRTLAENGYEYVKKRYDREEIARHLGEVLTDLLEESPAR